MGVIVVVIVSRLVICCCKLLSDISIIIIIIKTSSECQHKEFKDSATPSITSPLVDEVTMKPGH